MLEDPRTKEVTPISILVFIKRFAPDFPLQGVDSGMIYRYLGLTSTSNFPYYNFVSLIYPDGVLNTLENLNYIQSEVDLRKSQKSLKKRKRSKSVKKRKKNNG
jgi:hypothetical protein